MKANKQIAQPHATVWLGHKMGDNKTSSLGQTFTAEKQGQLKSIEVLSDVITRPGHIEISLHRIDPNTKAWGEKISSTTAEVTKQQGGNWIHFNVNAPIEAGQTYGFRLLTNDTLIGMEEIVGSASQPFAGQEYVFNDKGLANAFSYFSLVYKLGMN